MLVRMIVIMLVIMLVFVRIRHFRLLLGSLICLCHLSRGQVLAFQETYVSAAPSAMRCACGLRPYYYCTSLRSRGSNLVPSLTLLPEPEPDQNHHSRSHQCSRKLPESVALSENICSRIFHCIDCPGCSTTIPVSSSLAHWCPNGSS